MQVAACARTEKKKEKKEGALSVGAGPADLSYRVARRSVGFLDDLDRLVMIGVL